MASVPAFAPEKARRPVLSAIAETAEFVQSLERATLLRLRTQKGDRPGDGANHSAQKLPSLRNEAYG
jgi:hypothetical protein